MAAVYITFLSILSVALTAYVSKTNSIKPGDCPAKTGAYAAVCKEECKTDADCPANKKCCSISACATICARPAVFDGGSSSILDASRSSVDVLTESSGMTAESSSRHAAAMTAESSSKSSSSSVTESKRVQNANSVFSGGSVVGSSSGSKSGSLGTNGIVSGSSGFRRFGGATSSTSFKTTGLSGDDGSGCNNECVQGTDCTVGYTCVQSGCNYVCKVVAGTADDQGAEAGNVGRINVSILDSQSQGVSRGGTSARASVGSHGQHIVSGSSQIAVDSKCKKECHSDSDCSQNKSCVAAGCNMICRTRQITNGYKP